MQTTNDDMNDRDLQEYLGRQAEARGPSEKEIRKALAAKDARIAELEKALATAMEALKEYADEENWRVNRRFDANGGNFDGTSLAQKTLAALGGQHDQ